MSSCELKRIITLSNLNEVKGILFPENLTTEELRRDEDFDNRWSWDDASDTDTSTQSEGDHKWLLKCLVNVSPFEDLIVISRKQYIVVYKVDEEATPNHYVICGKTLPDLEPKEEITCITFCPFISQQRSNEGSVDWTCLIIGFNTGFIRIYTDNGYMLLSHRIDTEPVRKIQIQSFYSPYMDGKTTQTDVVEQIDEIAVFCVSLFAIIDGMGFHQTMRSLRNHLAKYKSLATSSFNTYGFSLPLKKFSFDGHKTVTDAVSCGVFPRNLYDHLSVSSLCGPYGSPPRSSDPLNTILSVGDNPFIGFSRAAQNQGQNILNDVAQAISKVTTFLPLFGKSEEKEKKEIATSLPLSLCLYDKHRKGKSVYVSPSHEFAVVCDDFGRVSLVNVSKQIIVRLWKGYRDAQCAWLEVKEDQSKLHSKKALYVCIYAPKRGILEVWRCINGPRIKVFNVGKFCRLLYTNYTLFGLNPILYPQFERRKMSQSKPNTCYVFDYTNASLSRLEISF